MKTEGQNLKQLGSNKTNYCFEYPNSTILETFDNRRPERDYNIEFIFNEFTSLCPKTGQPDFATIKVNYTPDKYCIESKSFKLYMFSYRQNGAFMETITNQILDDMVKICQPRLMKVEGIFNARGGTFINVTATYKSDS